MKLSIITINYNNAEGLRKTMESVFAQTSKGFEYIVIDGASSDDSVDIIKEYAQKLEIGDCKLENLQWISEPDSGIYEAMNRGIQKSSGEYVLMLNSGDFLIDEHVIERIMPELHREDIIQGNNIQERNGCVRRNRGYGRSNIDIFDIMKGHFLHQASFCRRDLFDRYGYFDESYRISADTKFFMICLGKYDATFKYVDVDITNYDLSGISSSTSKAWVTCREEEYQRIIKEVFSNRIFSYVQENDKKVRLYNRLHAHKWIWNLIMAVAHINNLLYKR